MIQNRGARVTLFVGTISFLIPVLGIWTPLGLVPLLAGAAIFGVPLYRLRQGRFPNIGRALPTVLVLFAGWSVVSLFWTPEPDEAARKLGSLALLVAIGVGYISCARHFANQRVVEISLFIGTGFAIVLIGIENFFGAPLSRLFDGDLPAIPWSEFLNRFNRGMTVIAILVWPAARAAHRFHPFASVALFLSAFALSACMSSAAALVALALGAAAYVLVRLLPRLRIVEIIGGLAAATILLMPIAVDQVPVDATTSSAKASLPNSGYHRLLIWKFTSDRISERPLLGWGFNASRSMPGRAKEVDKGLPGLPLHPHNAALQWRLELGVPGVILGAALIYMLFGAARRYERHSDRAIAVGMIVSGLVIALLSYGIWQSWWVATLLLSVACMPDNWHCKTKPA